MDAESLYRLLGNLVAAMPNLEHPEAGEVQKWLGRAYALVEATGDGADMIALKSATTDLFSPQVLTHERGKRQISVILQRRLAVAELKAPASAHGGFISAGNVHDALASVAKVMKQATANLLIVDPYMNETVLSDFAPMAQEGISLRLLTDPATAKPGLRPAVERWRSQYSSRPLEVRLAPQRSLHDRVIIVDDKQPWILTQSFNALAARSPASIVRVDGDAVPLKLEAYKQLWATATPL